MNNIGVGNSKVTRTKVYGYPANYKGATAWGNWWQSAASMPNAQLDRSRYNFNSRNMGWGWNSKQSSSKENTRNISPAGKSFKNVNKSNSGGCGC